jgi:hypothetical protein
MQKALIFLTFVGSGFDLCKSSVSDTCLTRSAQAMSDNRPLANAFEGAVKRPLTEKYLPHEAWRPAPRGGLDGVRGQRRCRP